MRNDIRKGARSQSRLSKNQLTPKEKFRQYKKGLRSGIPIGLGYFAVAFSLGIAAKNAGLNAVEGFVASLLTIASAGEAAGFNAILEKVSVVEMIFTMLVANCRYLLMSCALSQRMAPSATTFDRIGVGTFITDEIFGVNIGREGYIVPWFTYGVATTSVLPWAIGTSLGILVGNVLPTVLVNALSVSLYGMFLAIIIPPARKNKAVAVIVAVSFALSSLMTYLPIVSKISSGIRMVILTVLIASVAAIVKPVKEGDETVE